ncbi:MAG TPA: ClpX C4-type zinc finger protein [Pyrinomonadaceae bacterium]|nr:ClpX C4-type zinc finger protein [Pyrinomonadaceae bacterium]
MIAKMKAPGFRCSFCGRSSDEVTNMVAGTPQRATGVPKGMIGKSAFICGDCVERYHAMIAQPENANSSLPVPK